MRKRKRRLCLALALALCLTGCASGGAAETGTPSGQETGTQSRQETGAPSGQETGTAAGEQDRLGPLTDAGFPQTGAQVIAIPDQDVPLSGEEGGVLLPDAPGIDIYANSSAVIDYSNAADGYICVSWTAESDAKLKVLIGGPGGASYQYNLRPDGEYDVFPLSDGSGTYNVGVYKNASGTQYATILTGTVDARLNSEFAPFLRPNQYVYFTADSQAVKTAASVCTGAAGNLDKVERVYTYVVEALTYDQDKARTVTSGYLSDV
ncbi:MAG: hypothetical protein IJT94_13620, partial [Oscillibacter sp.]|nr:hypothetical protein [Oscillibacter sp.]